MSVVPYLAPVDVHVEDGAVVRVVVKDLHVRLDREAVAAEKRAVDSLSSVIDEIVGVSENTESWPAWEIGTTYSKET